MTEETSSKPNINSSSTRRQERYDPAIYGDPEKTPFVRYISGTPVYPPNTIYESAHELLNQPEGGSLAAVCTSLIKHAPLGGQYAVSPDFTWFAIFRTFLSYGSTTENEISDWLARCRRGLEIMQQRPHRVAWDKLKSFLRDDIDNLSGWSKSWRKSSAERDRIFRGEDGNYYYHDQEGILIQVIGGKTLEETRLDFITDQLVHSYGFLHQFIALFALFAIADDYSGNPGRYPKSMKAVLPGQDFSRVAHDWYFTFHERTRTIRWRPDSNMCDPGWLVADLLGEVTDTLQVDYWRKRIDTMRPDDSWIESDCPYQSDYVLDSGLRLGPDSEVLFEFEGKKFRWFNGTVERDVVISMGVKDLQNQDDENSKLNRLLTALVWEHKVPIRKLWGVGGPRRPYPTAYGPRQSGAIQVDVAYVQHDLRKSLTPQQWLALSLFKEAINSRSKFYSFLCFWKVLELAYPDLEKRRHWLNQVASAATREKDSVAKILRHTTDLEKYLRNERRAAVAHVFQERRGGSSKQSRPREP